MSSKERRDSQISEGHGANGLESEKNVLAPPPEIPNGGFVAWLQVVGAFFLFFDGWGVVNSFGVYQTFYERDLLGDESASNISWVGSIQGFLLIIGGVITGPIYDGGYFRALISAGAFLVVFGMMMTSLCTSYWQVVLAQGVVVGLGDGCLFLPSVAIVSQYFTTRKALATGIAAAGSGLGGVVYPIVFRQLQPRIGFGWATRVIAFIMLGTLAISVGGMRQRVPPSAKRKLFDFAAFKELPYLYFSLAQFFGCLGLYVPFFYVQLYAIEKGIITDQELAFYLLSILNAASMFGRVLPNFFADRIGPLTILVPFSFITGLLAFCWVAIDSAGALIVFCILYGFFSGTFVSLPGPAVISLSPNLGEVGTRMGMCFAFAGFGLLVGNPVAGAILRNHGWVGAQCWCGAANAMAAVFILFGRVSKAGLSLRVKA